MEERGRVSRDEAQPLEEVAESSGHFPRLLQQYQSTGGGYLWGVELWTSESCFLHFPVISSD